MSDRHTHIGSRISVRNREYVQIIDFLFLAADASRAVYHHARELRAVNCLYHFTYLLSKKPGFSDHHGVDENIDGFHLDTRQFRDDIADLTND